MGFPRQDYWSGLPFHYPRNLPDPGVKSRSPALPEDSLLSEPHILYSWGHNIQTVLQHAFFHLTPRLFPCVIKNFEISTF